MYRSVDMSYLAVVLPAAVAEEFADQMGREDMMQFTDLNGDLQPFQRRYTSDIMKIQEIERQAIAIEEMLDAYEVYRESDVTGNDLQNCTRPSNAPQIVSSIADSVGKCYNKLLEQSGIENELKLQLSQQEDAIHVLSEIDSFLENESEAKSLLDQQRSDQLHAQKMQSQSDYDSVAAKTGKDTPLLQIHQNADATNPDGVGLIFSESHSRQENDANSVGFKYFAGVVSASQRVSFERQVFLTSRGNSFVQFKEDSESVPSIDRIPFIVFFLGDELKRSLLRLCQFMNIEICYRSDNASQSKEEMQRECAQKRDDYYRIHSATSAQLERDMNSVSLELKKWKIALFQEKAIRITLNKFADSNNANFLRAEGWCPTDQRSKVSSILDSLTANKGVGRPIVEESSNFDSATPPTHFITNALTSPFQAIVDTYGVPRYKEFNPTVPTIMTFPFLFAVMYGDIFHGSFLCIFGLFLVTFGTRFSSDKPSMLQSFIDARYVLFFMGVFAVYCGLIYNDVMSLMINGMNGSKWGYNFVESIGSPTVIFQKNNVYAFGIDPVWHGLDNQLTFENSLKMKLSVTIGVIQMTFGLFLKLSNHIFERDYVSIFFEFVPQLIFMLVFFGYMIFLIVYKWCIDWRTSKLPDTPSLITVLIKMVLGMGGVDDSTQILENKGLQASIQQMFFLLMFIAIPWMLLTKPLILRWKHKRFMKTKAVSMELNINENDIEELKYDGDDDDDGHAKKKAHGGGGGGHGGHGEEFVFSEVFIHQLIHTIEYVLGTISNTASYLRLWALSLAHAQLSEVFYSKTIGGMMAASPTAMNIIINVAAQFLFLMFTFGVLLVMDVLECFLHALRLHWVEFQNKFFYADGIPFVPFSYRKYFDE